MKFDDDANGSTLSADKAAGAGDDTLVITCNAT